MWKRSMAGIVRHRQTKEPETDRPSLNHRATSRLYPCSQEEFWLHAKSPTHAPTEIWNSYGAGNRGKSPQLLPAEALPQSRTAVALCRLDCLSLPALPFLIRDAWNRHECITRTYIVSQPVHAADGMQLVGFDV